VDREVGVLPGDEPVAVLVRGGTASPWPAKPVPIGSPELNARSFTTAPKTVPAPALAA
jgi:hypothetical protein